MGRTYRRMTTSRVKKWMVGAGITGTILFGLFIYLVVLGDINIIGYSGNVICAGTEEDPCYAYLNFTLNKDYIYLYPGDWERDGIFNTDKPLDALFLEVRDKRYKSGWRRINLSVNKPKYKYAYRFYKTKGLWEIRFVAYKKNAFEDVKWSFTEKVDPIFQGVNINYELLENTDYCLSDCSLKFKFRINKSYTIDSLNKFRRVFVKVKGNVSFVEHGFRIRQTENYFEKEWVRNITCDWINYSNTTHEWLVAKNCMDNGYWNEIEKEHFVWKDFNPLGKTIQANKWYYIELWGRRDYDFDEKTSVDAVPVFAGFEFPFSIWDSYPYRYEIQSNATSIMPVNVNDTFAPNVWTLNATSGEHKYLYCVVSDCTDGNWAIGNTTDEVAWENGSSWTGNNPTLVWDDDTLGVYHLDYDGGDATQYLNNGTKTGDPALNNTDSIFGYSYEFDGAGDYFNIGDQAEMDGGSAFTATAWIYVTSTSTCASQECAVVTKNDDSASPGNRGWAIRYYPTGNIGISAHVYATSGVQVNSVSYIPDYTWVHVAMTYDGDVVSLYVNGKLNVTDSDPDGNINTNTVSVYIGKSARAGSERYFAGLIDEVRIYNRTLSATEIAEQYYNGINNLTSLGPEDIEVFEPLNLTLNGTSDNQTYELGTIADIDVSGNGTVCIRFNGSIDDICGTDNAEFLNAIYPHLDRDTNGNTSINISNNGANITFDLTNRSEMLNATINITGYSTGGIEITEDDTEDAHAFTGNCHDFYICANAYDENWFSVSTARPEEEGEVIIYENYTVPTHTSANLTIKHGKSFFYPPPYNVTVYYWDNADNSWKILATTNYLIGGWGRTETFPIFSNATNGTVLQFHTNMSFDYPGHSEYIEGKVTWYYNNPTLYPKDLEIDINNDNTTDYIVWGEISGTSATIDEFTNGKTEENLTYETGGINIRYIKVPRNISNLSAYQNFTFNISGFQYIDTEEIGQSLTINATNSPYVLYGNYTFDNFWIQSDGIVSVTPHNGTDSDTGTLKLDIRTNFTIESGGYIEANASGYSGGVKCNGTSSAQGGDGPGGGTDSGDVGSPAAGAGGGSYGGIGGRGGTSTGGPNFGVGGPIYGSNSSKLIQMGSGSGGGGCGGIDGIGFDGNAGGGSVWIVSPVMEIYGDIYANGSIGMNVKDHPTSCDLYGGGGGAASGGGILLIGIDVTISGRFDATGGERGNSEACGEAGERGGGGRIKIFYNTLTNTGTFDVDGYQDGSVFIRQEATAYATNVTIDIGADGVNEWEMDSATILNSTESPITVEISMESLLEYIDEDCNDYETYCLVPVQIATETPGIILVDDINLTYSFNPIVMNASKFNLSGNMVDINFSGEQIGMTELSGINFTYNGRYTYNVTGYNTTNQIEHMLDIYWSNFSENLPYTWTDEILPYPTSNNSKNITPWAQDSDTPILNITIFANHSVNISIALEQDADSCIDVSANTEDYKVNSTLINSTDRVTITDLNETDSRGFWLWFDYNNCDHYATRWFEPNATISGCVYSASRPCW